MYHFTLPTPNCRGLNANGIATLESTRSNEVCANTCLIRPDCTSFTRSSKSGRCRLYGSKDNTTVPTSPANLQQHYMRLSTCRTVLTPTQTSSSTTTPTVHNGDFAFGDIYKRILFCKRGDSITVEGFPEEFSVAFSALKFTAVVHVEIDRENVVLVAKVQRAGTTYATQAFVVDGGRNVVEVQFEFKNNSIPLGSGYECTLYTTSTSSDALDEQPFVSEVFLLAVVETTTGASVATSASTFISTTAATTTPNTKHITSIANTNTYSDANVLTDTLSGETKDAAPSSIGNSLIEQKQDQWINRVTLTSQAIISKLSLPPFNFIPSVKFTAQYSSMEGCCTNKGTASENKALTFASSVRGCQHFCDESDFCYAFEIAGENRTSKEKGKQADTLHCKIYYKVLSRQHNTPGVNCYCFVKAAMPTNYSLGLTTQMGSTTTVQQMTAAPAGSSEKNIMAKTDMQLLTVIMGLGTLLIVLIIALVAVRHAYRKSHLHSIQHMDDCQFSSDTYESTAEPVYETLRADNDNFELNSRPRSNHTGPITGITAQDQDTVECENEHGRHHIHDEKSTQQNSRRPSFWWDTTLVQMQEDVGKRSMGDDGEYQLSTGNAEGIAMSSIQA